MNIVWQFSVIITGAWLRNGSFFGICLLATLATPLIGPTMLLFVSATSKIYFTPAIIAVELCIHH